MGDVVVYWATMITMIIIKILSDTTEASVAN